MRSKKFHTINKHNPNSPDRFEEKKLSIEYCQKKLKKNGLNFSDKQVELIRDFLYLLAEIEYEHYKKISHEEESNPLHPRID
jgi:hypothetical protein